MLFREKSLLKNKYDNLISIEIDENRNELVRHRMHKFARCISIKRIHSNKQYEILTIAFIT